ncbi:2132_t:CDS:2, partial [Rhizophagus irregularis]
ALLTPSFSKYSVIWTQNLVEEMMDYWKDGEDDDGNFTTNIVEWSHRFTTDSITHFTTGMRVHAIEAHYNELLLSRNKKPRKSINDLKDATKFFKSIKTLTANLFTFVVYFLDKYPNVLRKLRDELDLFFKKLGDRRLDLDCLSQLVYTEAIIKEIFRIYTPAPYTARN